MLGLSGGVPTGSTKTTNYQSRLKIGPKQGTLGILKVCPKEVQKEGFLFKIPFLNLLLTYVEVILSVGGFVASSRRTALPRAGLSHKGVQILRSDPTSKVELPHYGSRLETRMRCYGMEKRGNPENGLGRCWEECCGKSGCWACLRGSRKVSLTMNKEEHHCQHPECLALFPAPSRWPH